MGTYHTVLLWTETIDRVSLRARAQSSIRRPGPHSSAGAYSNHLRSGKRFDDWPSSLISGKTLH